MSEPEVISDDDINAFATENGRTALLWVPDLPDEETRTFVGGYPRLPKNVAWNGDDSIFIAQIDLRDLPWRPDHWPNCGTLYIFQHCFLEGTGGDAPSLMRVKDNGELPVPFVYFATDGQSLVERKPQNPLSKRRFYNYRGNRDSLDRDDTLPLNQYALPRAAIRFAAYTDYYPGAWFNERSEQSGLNFTDAYQRFGPSLERLYGVLDARAADNRERARAALGVTAPIRGDEEAVHRRVYGGAARIDVDGLLQDLPEMFAFARFQKQPSLNPLYQAWPETGGMVFHHATRISQCLNRGKSNGPVTDRGRAFVQDARQWADWAEARMTDVLSAEDRDTYLSWAQAAFKEAIKVLRPRIRWRNLRKYIEWPIGKVKTYGPVAVEAMNIAKELLYLGDATEFGIRIMPWDEICRLHPTAREAYLWQAFSGQLFGWGREMQTEVRANKGHLCLAVMTGSRDIEYGGDFKIWMTGPLEPDAWQPVIVANSV